MRTGDLVANPSPIVDWWHRNRQAGSMLIRYGYDIELFCPAPVLMTTLLDAHTEHAIDIRSLGGFETSPKLDTRVFLDAYGNEVTRFVAPAGVTRVSRDCILESDGLPQPIKAKAAGVYAGKGRKATIDSTEVRRLAEEGKSTIHIAKALKIGRASVYRALRTA